MCVCLTGCAHVFPDVVWYPAVCCARQKAGGIRCKSHGTSTASCLVVFSQSTPLRSPCIVSNILWSRFHFESSTFNAVEQITLSQNTCISDLASWHELEIGCSGVPQKGKTVVGLKHQTLLLSLRPPFLLPPCCAQLHLSSLPLYSIGCGNLPDLNICLLCHHVRCIVTSATDWCWSPQPTGFFKFVANEAKVTEFKGWGVAPGKKKQHLNNVNMSTTYAKKSSPSERRHVNINQKKKSNLKVCN